jgi:hypothetical protein
MRKRGIVTPTEALEPVNTVITRSCPAALKRRGHYVLRILQARPEVWMRRSGLVICGKGMCLHPYPNILMRLARRFNAQLSIKRR